MMLPNGSIPMVIGLGMRMILQILPMVALVFLVIPQKIEEGVMMKTAMVGQTQLLVGLCSLPLIAKMVQMLFQPMQASGVMGMEEMAMVTIQTAIMPMPARESTVLHSKIDLAAPMRMMMVGPMHMIDFPTTQLSGTIAMVMVEI